MRRRHRRRRPRPRRPGHRGGRDRRRAAHAGIPGRPRAPGLRRHADVAVRPARHRDVRRERGRRSRPTPPRTPSCPGSSAAAGRWRRSPVARRPKSCSTRSCPTGRSSCRTATDTAAGSTRAALAAAGHHPRHAPIPTTAVSSGTPTASRPAACTRARWPWSVPGPAADRRRLRPRARCGAGLPVLARASPAGRTPSSARSTAVRTTSQAYVRGARDGRLKARVVGALWWDRGRGSGADPEHVARATKEGEAAGSEPRASRSCRTASPRTSPVP